jgi:hypothetical protein
MNLFTGESSDALFGGEAPPMIRHLLDKAGSVMPMERETLLWTAHALAPDCLPVYYLLYKFHAQQRQFELAEKAARKALAEAARQAGLPADCMALLPAGVAFDRPGPARFWLFTLKALGFINLRGGHRHEAAAFARRIEQLDPQNTVGGDVLAALLRSLGEGG